MIVVGAIFLLWAIGEFGGGGSSGPKADSPEYTAALDYCNASAGVAWYSAHPGASAASDADLRGYAGAVNRCLIDRLGVSPKYLPSDKPIQGIRP